MTVVLIVVFVSLTLLLGYAALQWLERYLDEVDAIVEAHRAESDELEARRATAPLTNWVLVEFPRRPAA